MKETSEPVNTYKLYNRYKLTEHFAQRYLLDSWVWTPWYISWAGRTDPC